MANYKFDGKDLRSQGKKVAYIDRKYIRDARGMKRGEFDEEDIRDANGRKVAQFDGQVIRDSSNARIGTLDDVKEAIDGIGGTSLVAMWLLFVR